MQPWVNGASGEDGYWHAGTWREDIGSWVIGPLHYRGVEGTNGYTDEISWVFLSYSCIDYLTHWTFNRSMFEDGSIGLCTKDDKWYGCTGYAVRQVYKLAGIIKDEKVMKPLIENARKSYQYLKRKLADANFETNVVEWVLQTTLANPMVNVG